MLEDNNVTIVIYNPEDQKLTSVESVVSVILTEDGETLGIEFRDSTNTASLLSLSLNVSGTAFALGSEKKWMDFLWAFTSGKDFVGGSVVEDTRHAGVLGVHTELGMLDFEYAKPDGSVWYITTSKTLLAQQIKNDVVLEQFSQLKHSRNGWKGHGLLRYDGVVFPAADVDGIPYRANFANPLKSRDRARVYTGQFKIEAITQKDFKYWPTERSDIIPLSPREKLGFRMLTAPDGFCIAVVSRADVKNVYDSLLIHFHGVRDHTLSRHQPHKENPYLVHQKSDEMDALLNAKLVHYLLNPQNDDINRTMMRDLLQHADDREQMDVLFRNMRGY